MDATGLPHGIFVDGYDNPGLRDVTIAGFTVENAQFEGIIVVNAAGAHVPWSYRQPVSMAML